MPLLIIRADRVVHRGSLRGELGDLGVVRAACAQCGSEDGGVGGHAGDRSGRDEVGQIDAVEPVTGQVVQPDRYAGVGEVLQSIAHDVLLVGVGLEGGWRDGLWFRRRCRRGCSVGLRWSSVRWRLGAVGLCRRRYSCRLSLAAAATEAGLKPNVSNSSGCCGAGAVVVDADDPSGVADDVAPAAGDAGFDADPCLDGGGDDRVAVGVVLFVEPFAAGHGHDAGGDPFGGELAGGGDRVLDLRAGADEDDVGGVVGVFQDVAAFADVAGVGEAVGAAGNDR